MGIKQLFNGIRIHACAIYGNDFAFGANFSGLLEYSNSSKYLFYMRRIGIHLADVERLIENANNVANLTGENRELALHLRHRIIHY